MLFYRLKTRRKKGFKVDRQEFIIDKNYIDEILDNLGSHLADEVFRLNRAELDLFTRLVDAIGLVMNGDLKPDESAIFPLITYNKDLVAFINPSYQDNNELDIKNIYREYLKSLELYISQIPNTITLVQLKERFDSQPGDSLRIKILKRIKNFTIGALNLLNKVNNRVRKIAGRKPKENIEWEHTVLVRQLFRLCYRNDILGELIPVLGEALRSSNRIHSGFKTIDRDINNLFLESVGEDSPDDGNSITCQALKASIADLSAEIDESFNALKSRIKTCGNNAGENYLRRQKLAGTVELTTSTLMPRKINRGHSALYRNFIASIEFWGNGSHFIFDDWRFDTSLSTISLILMEENLKFKSLIKNEFRSEIENFKSSFINLAKEAVTTLEKEGEASPVLKKIYARYKTGSASMVIRSLSRIKSRNLAGRINTLSDNFNLKVKGLSETRLHVKQFDPGRGVHKKEFYKIRPVELIRLEIVPSIDKELERLSAETGEELELIYSMMMEVVTIAEFSLETSLKHIGEKANDETDIEGTIEAGIARSADKLDEISKRADEMTGYIESELNELINDNIERILDLRHNDKVFALNLQLARTRMRKNLVESQRKIYRKLGSVMLTMVRGPYTLFIEGSRILKNLFSRVVGKTKPGIISSELSAFLAESKSALEKLPFIYQRLYLIEPLSDELFYVARYNEMEQIEKALMMWEQKQYSPVVILGEKGAGATSFINLFRAKHKSYNSIQFRSSSQLYTRESFINLLSEKLGIEGDNFAAIADSLNQGEEQIIFLEDLQNLYLRTVEGFNALKTLFSLMSATNEKVFWVTSCTRYAWDYLDRTINISAYFGTIIKLSQMDSDSIRQLIMKRHIISGFKLKYVPNRLQEKTKQYRKIPDHDKQEYLEEKYFQNMNRFAQGNISLALHFWLRSTKEVREKQIIISSIYDIDYSFLASLDTTRLIILTMICLHDGIDPHELGIIIRKPVEECDMMLSQLYDDSIIVKRNDDYLINPLLYRYTVDFLKNMNFIQ